MWLLGLCLKWHFVVIMSTMILTIILQQMEQRRNSCSCAVKKEHSYPTDFYHDSIKLILYLKDKFKNK